LFSWIDSQRVGRIEICQVGLQVWIENTDGDKIVKSAIGMVTKTFGKIGKGRGLRTLLHHNTLYSPASTFIKHGILSICCEILYKSSIPSDGTPQFSTQIGKKEWSLYQEGFTGPCIIEVGDQKFEVGKKRLMARSIVFDRMFKSEMKEA